jgi:Cu/Zn superoxide dismutase
MFAPAFIQRFCGSVVLLTITCLGLLAATRVANAEVVDSTIFAVLLESEQANACVGTASDRTGFAICVLNSDSTELSLHIEHNIDIADLTAGHIHSAPKCSNGGVVYSLGSLTSPITEVWTISPTDVQTLLDGNLYINLHTVTNPAGEIRGQIVQESRKYSFTLDESQLNTTGTDRTFSHKNGVALCELNAGADEFHIRLCHDVEPPYSSGLHIHKGLFGELGQVQFFVLDPFNPVETTWFLEKDDLINLFSKNLYLNLHSSVHLDGEIRGQVQPEELRFVFGLDGAQANSGAGTGSFNKGFAIMTLNEAGDSVAVYVEHDIPSDSADAAHIHLGSAGESGAVLHTFASAVSPISETWSITDAEFEQLVAGQLYIDVETPTNLAGEVRGQSPSVVDTASTWPYPACDVVIDEAQANACLGTGSGRTASGFAQLKKGGRQLNVSITHDIPPEKIVAGHIHSAPECLNGAVTFGFSQATNPVKEIWYPTHSDIVSLMRGELYMNLHTVDFPAGELRGQIRKNQSCCNVPGDADGSGSLTIGDVTFLIARIFSGGAAPDCCPEGDADGTGAITIGDVTYLIARIFSGGPAPICGPAGMTCGVE